MLPLFKESKWFLLLFITLVANQVFHGPHGWYWKNNSSQPLL